MIFAVDPGQKVAGFAIVTAGALGRVRFVEAGVFASAANDFLSTLERARALRAPTDNDLCVAIETPSGYIHDPFRGPTVIDTAWSAGGMAWLAEYLGCRVVLISAQNVRKALVGSARRGKRAKEGDLDKLVKAALNGVVDGMPVRSNVHVRDALAVSVVAHWMQIGKAA